MATMAFRASDPQQFDLYDAEHALAHHRDVVHYATKEQARAFVDRVLASPEWRALGGRREVKVVWTKHGSGIATSYGPGKICLPGWAYNQETILHELAHCVTDDGHGPVFAGTALMLYRKFIGSRFADAMEASYTKHGVTFKKRRFKYGGTRR